MGFIPGRGVALNRGHPLARDLLMWHSFDEGTGAFLFDASGHGRHGATWTDLDSSNWIPGDNRLGWAIDSDGASSNIAVTEAGWLETSKAFSVMVWAYVSTANRCLARLTTTDNFYLIANATPALRATVGGTAVTAGAAMTADTWHCAVITYDKTNVRIYQDGLLVGGPTSATGTYNAADTWSWSHATGELDGSYGQGAAWQRALSEGEVQQLCREPWVLFETQAIAASSTPGALTKMESHPYPALGGSVIGADARLVCPQDNDSVTHSPKYMVIVRGVQVPASGNFELTLSQEA